MEGLTTLAITGALVSVVAQFTKRWLQRKASKQIWVIVLSLGAAGILYLMNSVPATWMETAVVVWTMANTMYLVIMGWFTKKA